MRLLTVEEVCEITKLHERTIRKWMADGKLPFVRIGEGKAPPVRVRYRDLMATIHPGAPAA